MNLTKSPCTPATPCFPESPVSSSSTVVGNHDIPTLSKRRPTLLDRRFAYLLRPLAPLLSIETGFAHPRFPATLLQYHLLSAEELEDLAHFYHQRTPNSFSLQYPMPVVTRWEARTEEMDEEAEKAMEEVRSIMGYATDVDALGCARQIGAKRRRFGRFMGLQGMESGKGEGNMREQMERWVAEEMARRARRETELECWRRKGHW